MDLFCQFAPLDRKGRGSVSLHSLMSKWAALDVGLGSLLSMVMSISYL